MRIESFTTLRRFARDESGAVTVDFVVLCGAVVALAVGIGATIQGQVQTAAGKLGAEINAQSVLDGQ